MTELRYVPGSNQFSLHDVLTNHADYPHDYQIIYHSNFGTPILEEGARFLAPPPALVLSMTMPKRVWITGKPTLAPLRALMKWSSISNRLRIIIMKPLGGSGQ